MTPDRPEPGNDRPRRTRIAPTPSGYLHEGNAANFLLTAWLARAADAVVVLRIDDYDVTRMRPEYLTNIFEVIDWLGISIDEGPSTPDEFHSGWSSRLRREEYFAAAMSLGRFSFACDCSRADIARKSPDGRYPGTCRDAGKELATDRSSLRLAAADIALGDFIIWRRDGLPAYQLASVVDDVELRITDIVRGEDLRDSSQAQLFLARRLAAASAGTGEPAAASTAAGLFADAQIIHHGLITTGEGQKLSKSTNASGEPLRRDARTLARITTIAARIAAEVGIAVP